MTQFQRTVIVNNPLTIPLIELIETYDKLIAVVKLLQLANCFERDDIYHVNIQRFQKIANEVLSGFVLIPTAKLS